MGMQTIDWCITAGLLLVLTVAALFVKRYTQSVADFLAANRCAGRYLITISASTAGLGAMSFIGFFEIYSKGGFSAAWWQMIMTVQFAIVAITGWVIYRYRQTRVMTLAQFLEVRYSKRLRIFAGCVAWLAGVVNFGIFPAVGARFFIYFCGLPNSFDCFGLKVDCFALTMIVLLSFALFFTYLGGQIAVIVTDFIQGTFSNIMVLVIVLVMLSTFGWSRIAETLATAPEGKSLLHPFQATETENFNLWFFLIIALMGTYGIGSWQSTQGYGVCALNAHEARMANILASWRVPGLYLTILLMATCAYTFMHHAHYDVFAGEARKIIAGIDNPQIQKQMTTPIALSRCLPTGLMGAFAAVMLAAFISTHDTYLHSWGSVLVQDVIMPFRSKPFTPKQHMLLLRISILAVAVVVFCFSLLFRQTEYVHMFYVITCAIYISGAGAVVIGGLYWKRGTTAGAWSAMIIGAVLSIASVIIRQIHNTSHPFTGPVMGTIASQNPAILSLAVSIIAVTAYVLVSLLCKREVFNMDRMLHRGKYVVHEHEGASSVKPIRGWRAKIAMGNEFSRKDQVVYLASIGFTGLLIATFIVGTIYNTITEVSTDAWIRFWGVYIVIVLSVTAITAVWFTIGGLYDLKRMFGILAGIQRNDLDDGTVADHANVGEVAKEPANAPSSAGTQNQ